MSERECVCVCEHEGIKEESECTYFDPPVLTDASASAFLAPVLMLPVFTGTSLAVTRFLILYYCHSILVVCVGSIFFMKPCTQEEILKEREEMMSGCRLSTSEKCEDPMMKKYGKIQKLSEIYQYF